MARTNSRKINRRAVKKRSPLPWIFLILYMAGLAISYVYLHINNRKLEYSYEAKQDEVTDSQNLIRNLKAEVEKMTGRSFIMAQIRKFKMKLGPAQDGQIVEVTHLNPSERLTPQSLRDEDNDNTELTRR